MTTDKPSKLHKFLLILVLLSLAASQACATATATPAVDPNAGNQAIQVLNTLTPDPASTATPTERVPGLTLYVPNASESVKSQVLSQTDAFRQQTQITVEVVFPEILELPDGSQQGITAQLVNRRTPTVVALTKAELLYLAQKPFELLEPVPLTAPGVPGAVAVVSPFLDDAVRNVTLGKDVYGVPWQRYSCAPTFLYLAVVRTGSPAGSEAAKALAGYLASQDSQNSNLTNPNLRIFPTLRDFYDRQTVTCPAAVIQDLNPALNEQMVRSAVDQAQKFSAQRNLRFQPGQVAGIDGAAINGDLTVLKAFALPTTKAVQTYKDRLVVGSLTVIDPNFAPLGVLVNGKASSAMTGFKLPVDNYAIACRAPDNCLAISLSGNEYPLLPSTVKIDRLPAPVQAPTVAFLKGSVTVCFYVSDVQYCITVF